MSCDFAPLLRTDRLRHEFSAALTRPLHRLRNLLNRRECSWRYRPARYDSTTPYTNAFRLQLTLLETLFFTGAGAIEKLIK